MQLLHDILWGFSIVGLITFGCWALVQSGRNIGRAIERREEAMDKQLADALKRDRDSPNT